MTAKTRRTSETPRRRRPSGRGMQPHLGQLDATAPLERRTYLHTAFVDSASITDALDLGFPFVAGRKGSGKSAVAFHLKENPPKDHHVEYFRERESKAVLTAVLEETSRYPALAAMKLSALGELFELVWQHFLDVAVVHGCWTIAQNLGRRSSQEAKTLRAFLCRYSPRPGKVSDIVLHDFESCMQQLGNGDSNLLSLKNALVDLRSSQLLNDELMEAKDAILARRKLVICIDSHEQYETESRWLAGLEALCDVVYNTCCEGDLRPRVYVKCFVPTEMLEYLFRRNPAKFNGFLVPLEWQYATLIEFVARRYAQYLKRRRSEGTERHRELGAALDKRIDELTEAEQTTNKSWRSVWRMMCVPKVKNSRGWEEDSATYLVRHTQKRPRDILSCMNFIVAEERRLHDQPIIGEQALRDGLHSPGNMRNLLGNSLAVFDRPKELNWRTDMSGLIRRMMANEPTVFEYPHLQKILKRAFTRYEGGDRDELLLNIERILFRSGLLGECHGEPQTWQEDGGIEAGYQIVEFEYVSEGFLEMNEKSRCGMHPMLRDNVQNRRGDPRRTWVVYPRIDDDEVAARLGL